MPDQPPVGSVGWVDLTVPDADSLRDFYSSVVGWQPQPCDMGGYSDYVMCAPGSGQPVTGVCHARGVNAGLPAVWLVYFNVADLDASVAEVVSRGGTVVKAPVAMGPNGRFCIIADPAGAHCALFEPRRPQ